MSIPLETLFPSSFPIHPAASEDQRTDFAQIPAKPAVYLLTSPAPFPNSQFPIPNSPYPADHPLLLATTADLRAALKRRLADTPPDIKSKRIAYSQIATRIYYRPVYSPFAANFYYAHAARELFPQTADALAPWAAPTAAWFLAVERLGGGGVTDFPRIRKTNTLTDPAAAKDGGGLLFAGPIRDKHAANRLVELLEDLFDLCRYHHILIQAPHGKACAYKEMGKCPAPCDGSIPLAQYHQQIQAAWSFLTNPAARTAWCQDIEQQMKSAAARLQFETANRLKQRLARADAFNHEAFAHITPLHHFAFLALQRGPGKPYLEPWLIHAGTITPLPPFHRKTLPAAAQDLATRIAQLFATPLPTSLTPAQAAAVALVAHHLFSPKPSGIFLPLRDLPPDPAQAAAHISQAAESLLTKPTPPTPLPEQSSDPEIHPTP